MNESIDFRELFENSLSLCIYIEYKDLMLKKLGYKNTLDYIVKSQLFFAKNPVFDVLEKLQEKTRASKQKNELPTFVKSFLNI